MGKTKNLKPGAQMLWAQVLEVPDRFGHKEAGLHHFLLALLERHGTMAESLASGLNAADYRRQIERRLQDGQIGETVEPEKLLEEVLQRAREGGEAEASERHLAAVLLERDGWTLLAEPEPPRSERPIVPADGRAAPPEAKTMDEGKGDYRPRARHPTPLLEEFGRDLCREALEGKLPTILGRDVEMEGVMVTLCRWTKRNPLLIGPAGVGKTAILEGLAQRVVRGEVPPPIQGIRLFALQASSLVSGAGVVGKLEERMQAIVREASQDGIVLFIDEVHSIVGSGGVRQISDIGSLLKPALAKGEIACIGATTDAEYHTFIEPDRALERRFKPLRVQELSPEATMGILHALRERARRERSVTFSDDALRLIILLAQQYLRNRYFPDKAIDILEQCTAHAMLNEIEEVTPAVVDDVAERMVGMPIDLGSELTERLITVKKRLISEAFCPESVADEIVGRLEVTMRGLDVTPPRPQAVLLTLATAGQVPELTAQVLAQALYGSRSRLVEVDMARFTHPADVNWLLGAPPGYVGHDSILPFQLELAQQPWSVVLFKNVEISHPQAQEVLAQAFRSGYFTDGRGQKVYLSDATVVLTVTTEERAVRRLGFVPERKEAAEPEVGAGPDVSSLLMPALAAELDLCWLPAQPTAENVELWVEQWVLPPVSERYGRHGLEIEWDPSILKWLAGAIVEVGDLMRGERLLEEQVLPLLIPYLKESRKVLLSREKDGSVQIQAMKGA